MSLLTSIGRRLAAPEAAGRAIRDLAPVPFSSTASRSNIFTATPTVSHQATQLAAMEKVGVVFAMVDKLATGVSSVDWALYRKARSGRAADRTPVADHPALTVLRRPNPFMTCQELIEAGQQHQDLTGETWWVIGYDPRVPTLPIEIWPVRPDRMAPVQDPVDFISGYIHTDPDGRRVPLGRHEVIFMRRPNPLDPYRGIGPIQSVMSYIDGERYSAEWNRNFFKNGAMPGGIIEVERRLADSEFDELAARWKEQHQGVSNAHRVAILEQAKWVDVKLTQRDMQFAELAAVSDEKIRQAFGFPKPMLGSVDDVNRANAEAAAFVFAAWCLVPRLERLKGALNSDFLPLFPGSEGLEFDYESPVPEDEAAENAERDSRVKAVTALIGAGFDPAEVLEWAEMPPLTYEAPAPVPTAPAPAEPADPATTPAALAGWLTEPAGAGERRRRADLLASLADVAAPW